MSPRSRERNQEIRDDRREQILAAAARVFAHKGLANARIAEIATEAGLSQGLIYHYFPEKDSLLAQVVDRAIAETRRMTETAMTQPGTPWERLCSVCTAMLAHVVQEPSPALISLQAMTDASLREQVNNLLAASGQPVAANLIALFRQGQEAGEVVAGDPRTLAVTLLAIINGITLVARQGPEIEAVLPTADLVMRMFRA